MSNGAVLWNAAWTLVSVVAITIAAEYSVVLAILFWFVATVILITLRPPP